MKKLVSVFCAGALLFSLAACVGGEPPTGSASGSPDPGTSAQEPAGSQSSAGSSSQQADGSAGGSQAQPQGTEYTLYIGMDGTFQEYPMTYEGELDEQGLVPAEAMIAGMAELTGWNLDLADEITSGPGGMTVSFADTCSIFTGPPDPQKEEFHVYDAGELAATILDSIQHTLQYNFVDPEKGEPSSLDIYYCDAAGESITIPGLDVTIPMDTPYSGLAMA